MNKDFKNVSYTHGLHEVADNVFAYLQPDGGWGWSNAGLIASEWSSLLVDTLFDLKLTRNMLDSMSSVTSAHPINVVVNTHANGDHCYGNQLVEGARIIASRASAEEMDAVPPAMMAEMLRRADELGVAGAYFQKSFGDFEFEGITPTPPTETFEQQHRIQVGDKQVELIEVGPAHTRGDILVHLPEDGIVFTGDILFIEGTPILWEGPVSNWIDACDRIMAMKPKVIVPGHGPLTDLNGVRGVREYLKFIRDEARERFEAGLTASEAARDIALGDYSSWLDSERIVINVQTLYSEFDPNTPQANLVELFGLMGEIAG